VLLLFHLQVGEEGDPCNFVLKLSELEKEKWIVCAVANRNIMYALCCAELGLGISMLLLIWSLMMI